MNSLNGDFLVVAVVAAYLGFSALVAYLLSDNKRQEPPTQIEGQNNSSAATRGEPIAVRIVNAPPTSDDQKQYEQDNTGFQRKSFIVGVVTLAVLIGYTGINYLLYRTTLDTEQVSLRAYVNVREAFKRDPLRVGQPWPRVWLSYENTGNTPANHFCISGDYVIGQIDRIVRHRVKSDMPFNCTPGGVLPPRVIANVIVDLKVTAAEVVTQGEYDAIQGGRLLWVVYALIDYCDQFGNSHQSEQSFNYDPSLDNWEAFAQSTVSYDTENDPECRQTNQ